MFYRQHMQETNMLETMHTWFECMNVHETFLVNPLTQYLKCRYDTLFNVHETSTRNGLSPLLVGIS